jgi:REP element-mobilizing transposase RayT
MARKPRVEFDGALYHVIVRGNQRQRIFRDNLDRQFYLDRIEHYRERYGFAVYAYVLMSNHVHLLLQTRRTPLAKIVQGIQFAYTQYYNRRHRTVGHLFQGRYKAILCDRDPYLLELVRYIHLNPGRLKKPENAFNYRWSSHRSYLGQKQAVKVEAEPVLGQLGRAATQARRAYRRFMEEGLGIEHEEKYYQLVDQRFLGDEEFVQTVAKKTDGKEIRSNGRRIGFDKLLKALAETHGVEGKVLTDRSRKRQWAKARAQLAYLAREWSGLTAKDVGQRLHRDPSMVSRLCAWYAGNRDEKTEGKLSRLLSK